MRSIEVQLQTQYCVRAWFDLLLERGQLFEADLTLPERTLEERRGLRGSYVSPVSATGIQGLTSLGVTGS